jgi:cephalosporin-C deacetylase-like acetyl esterase
VILRLSFFTRLSACLALAFAWLPLNAVAIEAVPDRVSVIDLQVAPDHADWLYQPGEKVTFRVSVTADGLPLAGSAIEYRVGPEMMPTASREANVSAEGLLIDGGTLDHPGFIRCVVTATIDGRSYRSLATAGFAPEKIAPTQEEPADFDAFWNSSKEELAKIPLEPRLELIPEASKGAINVYHVSFRTWSRTEAVRNAGRIYGILCEPKAPGRYPAILRVPSAGVRPYSGQRELAERGAITLEIGIHGIPVTHPLEIYDQMRTGALDGYPNYNLDDREFYYFRRVYLGCLRANDFLTTREAWDGRNLLVFGASQGGQLTTVTAALDPRVTAAAAVVPAYCDVSGYLHDRAGGWPHMMRGADSRHRTPAKIATTQYYDTVNFAKRVRAPIFVALGYNDETCPPTSIFSAYNSLTAPKRLLVAPEMTHAVFPEVDERVRAWLFEQIKRTP